MDATTINNWHLDLMIKNYYYGVHRLKFYSIFIYNMAWPTLTRGFLAPNPVTCISREALTNQSSVQVKKNPQIRFESLNLPLSNNLSLKPPSSSTISQNPSLKDTNLKHHHHQPSLKTTISVTWYLHFSNSGENES